MTKESDEMEQKFDDLVRFRNVEEYITDDLDTDPYPQHVRIDGVELMAAVMIYTEQNGSMDAEEFKAMINEYIYMSKFPTRNH